jgi:hypothetical protein
MRAVQAAHRHPARGGDQAAVDLSARPAVPAVVSVAGVHAVPASRVALPVGRCRRDRQWAEGIAARRAPVAVGADPPAVRGSCPAVDPGQGRAAGPPLDPDGGLQVAMVVAAARAATNAVPWRTAGARPRVWARRRFPAALVERNPSEACAAPPGRRGATVRPARAPLSPGRGPTPPDPTTQAVAARRRRGRSLHISPPAVERRECRPLSSINLRTRTRLATACLRLSTFRRGHTFRPPTSSRRGELPWCYSPFCPVLAAGLRSRPTRSVSESRCAR